MISMGSKIKKEILKVNYQKELYIDIISKVDTTSAYVWLSMNLYNDDRIRIDSASASILATPLDLRIYFDIGGGGYEVRQDYYKFIRSDYFTNFRDHVNLEGMEVFDNDWYCFIVDRSPLKELGTEQINLKATTAEKKLAEYSSDDIITWNRMLCGYILERGDIGFEEIRKKLDVVIKLYYCFEQYRQKELNRKEAKFKYDVGSLCSPSAKNQRTILKAKNLNIKGLR